MTEIETIIDPPKYTELFNFLQNNSTLSGEYLFSPTSTIEDFEEEISDPAKSLELYQKLKGNNMLGSRHADFNAFAKNFELPSPDQEVVAPMITDVSYKEGKEVAQTNLITSQDDINKSNKKRNQDIELAYTNEQSNYKNQLEKKEIDNDQYEAKVRELEKQRLASIETSSRIKAEDESRLGLANPIIRYRDKNKKGDIVDKQVGVHDWAYRQASSKEKDLESGDYFFKLNNARRREEFLPFLENQYPGYSFSDKTIALSMGAAGKANENLIVTNDKTGETVSINMSNKNINNSKRELFDFINKGGINVASTISNLSQQAEETTKIVNTPFNAETPGDGGVALNDRQKMLLTPWGNFSEVQTEIGNVSEFNYNPTLFATPREMMIQSIEQEYPGRYFKAVPDIIENISQYSIEKVDRISRDPVTEGIKKYLEDTGKGYGRKGANQGDYGTFVPAGNLYDLNTAQWDKVIDENTFINSALTGGVPKNWEFRPGTEEAQMQFGNRYAGPGTKIWNNTTLKLNKSRALENLKPATEEDIKNQVARTLYEQQRSQAIESNWDAYLSENPTFLKSDIIGSQIIEKDANLTESVKLQELNKLELYNLDNPNTEDNLLIDYFEDIYNSTTKDFPSSTGEMVKFKNGKVVSKELFNQYEKAANGKQDRVNELLKRRQKQWELQDETGDIDISWDLLRRDYNTWRKSVALVGYGFADIGVGVTYLAGKAIKAVYSPMSLIYQPETDEISYDPFLSNFWKEYDATLADLGRDYTESKDAAMSQYAKDVDFHQNQWGGRSAFAGSFGTFMAQEVSRQIPILASMMTTGGTAGPLLIGAYSAGDHWMQDDIEERKTGVYRSEWMQGIAAIGYGASEAIFERLTTVPILKRGSNLISRMGERSVLDYKDSMKQYFKQELKMLPQETLSETIGEGMTQITQNLIDGRPAMEGVDHAAFVGGAFGFSMSASPFLAGAAAQSFTDYDSMKEFRDLSRNINSLERQRVSFMQDGISVETLDQTVKDLKDKQKVLLNTKFNQISQTLSKPAVNRLMNNYSQQELIRVNVKDILSNNKISKSQKQKLLQYEKSRFDALQYDSNGWNNKGAFGNDFALLKTTDNQKYEDLISKAKLELSANSNKIDDLQEIAIQDKAYDLYVGEDIDKKFALQEAINEQKGLNINLMMANTNKEANQMIDEVLDQRLNLLEQQGASSEDISNVKEQFKNLKQQLANGNNGVNIPALKAGETTINEAISMVFKENAIKNDKRQVGLHEVGHSIFEELISRNSQDFVPLANTIVDYLNQTKEGRDVLTRISKRDVQVLDMADELVMNFLEEVGNDNVPLSSKFATLFGSNMNEGLLKGTDGEFQFDFKGSGDAMASLIGLGKAIASGQLTTEQVQQIKESKVFEGKQKAETDTSKEELKGSGIAEDEKQKKTRRDLREEDIKEIYDLHAWDKNQEEWEEFLETDEGRKILDKIIAPYEIEIKAIAKGDVEVMSAAKGPIIRHIKAFNPEENNDLAGYIGGYLSRKVGSGRKTLEKGAAPKGTKIKRIGEKQEGGREFDIEDKSVVKTQKEELNFRNKLKIESGGELYNSILKKAKVILSTLKTNLTVPKTNITLKEVKQELDANPNNNTARGNLNKIFKDFRQTLKKSFDTSLFKEIKNTMGTGKKYDAYLKSNKAAIISGLPIADLVQMQKMAKDKILVRPIKENLSPSEIKQYEGSPDLMYVNPTSGPTVYKRLNPSDVDFIEFMKVRGRKDALARNMAGKLGEDATMETLANPDVVESFLIKNPSLETIPTDMLKNSIAQAIDSGIDMKFSGTAAEQEIKAKLPELTNTLLDVQSNTGFSTDQKELKNQVEEVVDMTYPEKITGKGLVINQLVKYLLPYAKQIQKYKDVKINLQNYIKSLTEDRVINKYGKFFGIKNLTESFRTKIKEQKKFHILNAKAALKLKDKDGNLIYKNPLNLAAEYFHYKAMMYDGTAKPSRAMTFYDSKPTKKDADGNIIYKADHKKVWIEEFMAPTFSDPSNPIVNIKNTSKKDADGNVINQVEFIYEKGPSKFVDSPTMENQAVTQEMVDNNVSKKELKRRKFDSDRAFNFVVNQYKAAKVLTDKGLATNENVAMLAAGMGANMTGPIRAAATLRYLPVNSKYKTLKTSKGKKAFEYEHGIPAVIVNLAIADAVLNPKSDIDLKKLQESYTVGVIDVDFNDNFGRFFKSRMPFNYKIGDFPTTRWYNEFTIGGEVHELFDLVENKTIGTTETNIWKESLEISQSKNKTNQKVNVPLVDNAKVMDMKNSENMSSEDVLNKAASLDEALRNARNPNAPVKKIRVFDFDDTLARTKSNILYTMPDGATGKLTAEEFAKKGDAMLAEGAVWDFSEFNKVMDGKKGPLFSVAQKIQEARGTDDVFVLTARAQEASPAIKEFLDSIGLEIPLKNISGLGNSSPFAKSNWIVDKAAEGYNDFYFADDHTANVRAVKDALEVLDVKSKTQQAKIKFSGNMSEDFNIILEESKGVDRFKIYSDVKAQLTGARKGRGKFFIPPSAEDFLGLLYATLGKGKQGEKHLQFYDKALFKPYAQAMENLATDRVNLMSDFKALKKELDVPKDLQKATKSGFTNEQAVRVYLWAKTGQEIPGISKADFKELNDIVENDPKLKVFADQILSITKGDGYSKPGKNWTSGTITTDLIEILNTTKRTKYLETWQANVDLIFSKDNMNKLESIFGPKYVEALRNSLSRMKAGRNRIQGGNRLSNRVLDYINNSTGAIMFFNMRSALLQTISAANFINWSFNNPLKAGKAFANQPQYWKDFKTLMNSDYLVDRRNGLKLNINESEIADAAKTSKNKARAVISYIIEKGYIPTKFADSFAIATGGATFYRNRINDLIKNEGKTEAEAKKQAMEEFTKTSEISQQSSDPAKISQQQSTDLGRVVLQFVNTPMQYARIQKKAAQDIANGRGDNKTNVSKIIYYGFLQNMIFNALQSGLFAMGFGDDDEIGDEDEKKIYRTANGMMDSWLRGLGFAGVTVQVLKNLGIDIYDRSKRDRPEYGDAWMKLLEFSPAIKSKLSKIRSAAYPFDSKKRRAEVFNKGFSLDNPAYESIAKVITATTNLPIDRLFTKVNNIKGALDDDQETWKSVAMILGWPEWQLNSGSSKKEEKKDKNPFSTKSSKKDKNPFAVKSDKKDKNPFAM